MINFIEVYIDLEQKIKDLGFEKVDEVEPSNLSFEWYVENDEHKHVSVDAMLSSPVPIFRSEQATILYSLVKYHGGNLYYSFADGIVYAVLSESCERITEENLRDIFSHYKLLVHGGKIYFVPLLKETRHRFKDSLEKIKDTSRGNIIKIVISDLERIIAERKHS